VTLDAEGAHTNSRERVNCCNYIKDRDLRRGAGQDKAPVHAAVAVDEAGTIEGLQDFVEIAGRDLGDFGDFGVLSGFSGVKG